MIRKLTFVFSIISILTAFSSSNLSCTLARKSLSKFDKAEYVFIGTVVGFTEPIVFDVTKANGSIQPMSSTNLGPSEKAPRKVIGLIVKVTDAIHLPQIPSESFEVFPYELWADCSVAGKRIDKLRTDFPVGSEIRVIAREAEFVAKSPKDGIVRLEEHPDDPGSIALNIDQKGNRMTSAISIFDYQAFTFDMNRDSDSKYFLPSFEIRKDLLRLEKAEDQNARKAVLGRLFYAPTDTELNFEDVSRNYAVSPAEADRLSDARLRMTSPEAYEQLTIYRQTLAELLKLGFEQKAAEKALGKALVEGTEIEKEKLLKKSLQFLEIDTKKP